MSDYLYTHPYAESTGTDWEHWSRQNEALASRVPYMVSIGNHEYDYISDENHNDPSVTDGNYSVMNGVQAFPGEDGGGECAVPVVHRCASLLCSFYLRHLS